MNLGELNGFRSEIEKNAKIIKPMVDWYRRRGATETFRKLLKSKPAPGKAFSRVTEGLRRQSQYGKKGAKIYEEGLAATKKKLKKEPKTLVGKGAKKVTDFAKKNPAIAGTTAYLAGEIDPLENKRGGGVRITA